MQVKEERSQSGRSNLQCAACAVEKRCACRVGCAGCTVRAGGLCWLAELAGLVGLVVLVVLPGWLAGTQAGWQAGWSAMQWAPSPHLLCNPRAGQGECCQAPHRRLQALRSPLAGLYPLVGQHHLQAKARWRRPGQQVVRSSPTAVCLCVEHLGRAIWKPAVHISCLV